MSLHTTKSHKQPGLGVTRRQNSLGHGSIRHTKRGLAGTLEAATRKWGWWGKVDNAIR